MPAVGDRLPGDRRDSNPALRDHNPACRPSNTSATEPKQGIEPCPAVYKTAAPPSELLGLI